MVSIAQPNSINIPVATRGMQQLVTDLVSKGPIRLLFYSATASAYTPPEYSNAHWTNNTLIASNTATTINIVDGNIVISGIPDILNTSPTSVTVDIIEVRSTVGDDLYFRVEADHRRLFQYDIYRLETLVIDIYSGIQAGSEVNLYPNTSPYPVTYRIEFPLWVNASGYNAITGSELVLNYNSGIHYDDDRLVFPTTKQCGLLLNTNSQPNGDYFIIDGSFSNSNLDFTFSFTPTVPDFGVSNTIDPVMSYDGFGFSLIVTRTLFYNPYSTTVIYPSWIDDNPRVFRQKFGEGSFTEIPCSYFNGGYGTSSFNYTVNNYNGTYTRYRHWVFGVLV